LEGGVILSPPSEPDTRTAASPDRAPASRTLTRRGLIKGGALATTLALAGPILAACGRPGASGSVAQSSKVDSIQFLTPPWGVAPDAKLLAEFEKQAGFKIEVQSMPYEQTNTKVQTASAAGTAPADAIFLTQDALSVMIVPGYLEPLDEYLAKWDTKDVDSTVMGDFGGYDTKQYALLTYVQLAMMDYNQKRLAEAGFEKPPTTWAEFETQARAVKAKGIDQYPAAVSISTQQLWQNGMALGDPFWDQGLEPVFAKPGSGARQGLELLFRWYASDLISPEFLNTNQPHALFFSGTGTLHQSWQGSDAVSNNPKTSKQAPDVRYMLVPEKHFTKHQDGGIGISRYSKAKASAWKFAEWYATPANQRAVYDAYGLTPSRLSVQQELNAAGKIQQYELQVEQARTVFKFPQYLSYFTEWATNTDALMRKSVQTDKDFNGVIDAAAKDWNRLRSANKK
jgi:multiple sugar transport system substrate-binding protein